LGGEEHKTKIKAVFLENLDSNTPGLEISNQLLTPSNPTNPEQQQTATKTKNGLENPQGRPIR
jgi:hypothetical protein